MKMSRRRFPAPVRVLAAWGLVLWCTSCNDDQLTVGGGSVSPETSSPILFTSGRNGNLDIFLMRSDGGASRYLTRNAAFDHSAEWFPDGYGLKMAFMSSRDGDYEIFVMLVASRELQQLTDNTARDGFPRWSPDGSRILFTSDRGRGLEFTALFWIPIPEPLK